MGVMKKFCLFAWCVAFGIAGAAGLPAGAAQDGTGAQSGGSVPSLTLYAENCNMILQFSSDGQFRYEYDDKIFALGTQDDGSGKKIQVSRRADAENVQPLTFVTIGIPNVAYDQVIFNLEKAGVRIPAMNCDVRVTANQSAVAAEIPAGFDKTFTYHSADGSGTIALSEDAEDIRVVVDAQKSAVSVPEDWPDYRHGETYARQTGRDTGSVMVELDGCAFGLTAE